MKLSIEVNIEPEQAREIAREMGMIMVIINDPEEPGVEVSNEQVDLFLEASMKEAVMERYETIINKIYKRELVEQELAIQKIVKQQMSEAISTGTEDSGV